MSGECDDCGHHCTDCDCHKLNDRECLVEMIKVATLFARKYCIDHKVIAHLLVNASCYFAKESQVDLRDYCRTLYSISGVYMQHCLEAEDAIENAPKKKAKKSRK